MIKDVAWEKNADEFLNSMSNIHLFTNEQRGELNKIVMNIAKCDDCNYLKKFIDKGKEIKSIDSLMFSQNYEKALLLGLLSCTAYQNKEATNLWLTSDLLNIHEKNISNEDLSLLLLFGKLRDYESLRFLLEKNVDFTHKSKDGNNIFHQLGVVGGSDEETIRLQCLDYLMNQDKRVKRYLENTNYQMLHEENDKGLGPIVMYLRSANHQLALFVVNQMSNFEVLEKIQSQINVYGANNKLSDQSLEVVTQLNEKIMIKNEKDTLSTVISGDSLNKLSKNHKI